MKLKLTVYCTGTSIVLAWYELHDGGASLHHRRYIPRMHAHLARRAITAAFCAGTEINITQTADFLR